MADLRKLAKGRECQVRLPGICNQDNETTVLAHYRLIGVSGMGLRATDVCASYACSACHDAADFRMKTEHSDDYIRRCHLEGVMRTLNILVKEGVLKW